MSLPSSESEFSSTITRIAVAQICQSVGYNAAQTSALYTLADIATRYLRAIAHSAAESANSTGRTQSNLFDIIIALEDLGSLQGFLDAHKIASNSMISSSVLKDIMSFLHYSDEIPFAQPIPRKVWPESRRNGNVMKLMHVPRWLPDMPVMDGMVRMGMCKVGNGEESFVGEDSGVEKKGTGNWNENGDGNGNGKGNGFELPEKRGKVRFKMGMRGGVLGGGAGIRGFGMEMKNGVWSRGGIGKRILCRSWSCGDDGNEEDGIRKKVLKIST